ncbi:MAG: hypothetical protein U1D55_07510 [Phycisphaerae bacterium]
MMAPMPLGEVAEFVRGVAFDPSDRLSAPENGHVACFRTSNIQDELEDDDLIYIPRGIVRRTEQFVESGDLLVSSANSWELVGKTVWVPKLKYPATAGGFISILRANRDRVDARYLYHWFRAPFTQHRVRLCGRKTTNISNLSYPLCLQLPMPLPYPEDLKRSLVEQKRIAAILDKADAIRRRRVEAARLADQLIPSLFYDMFGTWLRMPQAEMARVGEEELADIASGVTKGRRFEDQETVVVPYIRVANVQDGYLDLTEIKTIEVLPQDVDALRLEHGDVLMTEGGDFDKLGRGGIWEHDVPNCIHQNHVFRVRCNRRKMLPLFFANYIRTTVARAYFLRCAKKTSNLASINMTQLRALPVPRVPIAEQKRFATEAEEVRQMQRRDEKSIREADDLFSSLVQRAFRGEL